MFRRSHACARRTRQRPSSTYILHSLWANRVCTMSCASIEQISFLISLGSMQQIGSTKHIRVHTVWVLTQQRSVFLSVSQQRRTELWTVYDSFDISGAQCTVCTAHNAHLYACPPETQQTQPLMQWKVPRALHCKLQAKTSARCVTTAHSVCKNTRLLSAHTSTVQSRKFRSRYFYFIFPWI